jgi:hypothetical protein
MQEGILKEGFLWQLDKETTKTDAQLMIKFFITGWGI